MAIKQLIARDVPQTKLKYHDTEKKNVTFMRRF